MRDGVRDSTVDGDTGRLRAEAVAMLSEQAALCSAPSPVPRDAPCPAAAPAPGAADHEAGDHEAGARRPVPAVPGGADTAALLRELSSLGADDPLPLLPAAPAPPAPPASASPRRGLFRRRSRITDAQ